MAQGDVQERTEQATAKRLRDARERGQVPRSRELNTFAMMVAGSVGLLLLGPAVMERITALMKRMFQMDRGSLAEIEYLPSMLKQAIEEGLAGLLPLFGLLMVVALLGPLALGGWTLSSKAIQFKWERIDPVKGLGRIFSARGLMELGKAVVKFSAIGATAGVWLWYTAPAFLNLGRESVGAGIVQGALLVGSVFLVALLPLLVIAGIDVPFQLWEHGRRLRMTRRELKDELKDTEGSPEVRSRIKRQQQELAQRRMMEEIPSSDVIITNPSEYAVALRYRPEHSSAPTLVAKGAELLAVRIRQAGTNHDVPVVEAPPLARALYFSTELGHEIPAGLYTAVAQVLAYVYHLKRADLGTEERIVMQDLPIPEAYRRD